MKLGLQKGHPTQRAPQIAVAVPFIPPAAVTWQQAK